MSAKDVLNLGRLMGLIRSGRATIQDYEVMENGKAEIILYDSRDNLTVTFTVDKITFKEAGE